MTHELSVLHPLNLILGSAAKVQLLRAVLPLTSPFTGREAQRLGGVRSTAGAQKSLEELTDLNLLQRVTAGALYLYTVNTEHHLYGPLLMLFAEEGKALGRIAKVIEYSLETQGARVISVVLFGSAVRGEMQPKSDLDLLVIVDGKSAEQKVQEIFKSRINYQLRKDFGLEVSAYVLTRQTARRRFLGGDPLMKDVATNGRAILGLDAVEAFEGRS